MTAFELVDIDHLVLTVRDLAATLEFYTHIGMRAVQTDGRHELRFGTRKINIHTRPGEFQPAAQNPQPGTADLCFEMRGSMKDLVNHVTALNIPVVLGPVGRIGARGPMKSLYLRDPDGNLVELALYK